MENIYSTNYKEPQKLRGGQLIIEIKALWEGPEKRYLKTID